jgi:hypothetical protein
MVGNFDYEAWELCVFAPLREPSARVFLKRKLRSGFPAKTQRKNTP